MSRKMILDQLGDQLACSVLDWNKKVLKYVQDLAAASDESTIVSYGVRSCAEYAAFANATFGHGFAVDDFNPAATAHPGCVAVPASLSVGEREHLSGRDLLTGVALASEVITRVGPAGMKWMLARANGGIRSALLARNGLTGPLTILEGQRGVLQSFGGQFVAEKLTDRLGDYFVFLANGFKPYCCAIDIHSPIDARR